MKDKRRFDFIPNRLNKYSIRKFSVGIASILVGATLFFGLNNEAKADEVNVTSEHGNNNGENASSTSEDETDQAQTQETAQSDASTPEASQ